MRWAWIDIVLGVLVILYRGPLVFSPIRTIEVRERILGTNTRARLAGALLLAFAVAFFVRSGETSATVGLGLVILAGACLAAALWMLSIPERFRVVYGEMLAGFKENPGAARGFGVVYVLFGALIIHHGLRAL